MSASMFRTGEQEAKKKASNSVESSLFKSCTKNLGDTGIKFSDTEVSILQTKLSNNRAVHLRSDALTLCSILLQDCLQQCKYFFVSFESLHINKIMLPRVWFEGDWEWLIVFCDSTVQQSDISDTCSKFSDIIQCASSSKHVIILTACSVQQISKFVPIEHKFKFEQLSKESQAIVLDKTIDFQGCEVTMRSVLEEHVNVQHVLGPELVTDMITDGTAVNIGGKLQVNEENYAPRVLERKVCLHSNVLLKSNDVFVVDRSTKKDLLKIVPSDKIVDSVCLEEINVIDFTQDMGGKIFLLSDKDTENSFLAMCKKSKGKTLHWLELKNGDLLWKRSSCGTYSLLDYIDADKTRADKRIIAACMERGSCEVNEDSIWDLGERTVLVVDEPGMGKSRTTTQVAWHTKGRDPTSWVVRINWNDHTGGLQEIDEKKFNSESLVEFLFSAAFPESKYTDTNRYLLQQALQISGNVTVLMDEYDEISPIHRKKASVVLFELMKTKVRRLWVTSYPLEKERLEKELSVSAYGMKRLSSQSQVQMFLELYTSKEIRNKEKFAASISQLLERINQGVNDSNFTGSPLYITMTATALKLDMEAHLKSEDYTGPRIDLVDWYNSFVKMILLTHLTKRQKADIINATVLDFYAEWKRMYLKNFEKCALIATLPPSMLKSLHNKEIEEEIQSFLVDVEAGEITTSVVMNVVDGKPQFVHQTFAEYFTARWFSRNFQLNRSVMERILYESNINGLEGVAPLEISHSFVRNMFDRILARGSPLHTAVLDCDQGRVVTLLEEGCYANSVDLGGRTPMHLIAAYELKSGCEGITKILLNHGASVNQKDNVLQWTPLHYAIKSGSWSVVELLLEHKADESGLELIRKRIDDQDYIGQMAKIAEECGHSSLLQFLGSIGVNQCAIHAAVDKEQLRAVKWPINNGADCNTLDRDDQTPLSYAVPRDRLNVQNASLDVYDKKDTSWRGRADRELDEEPPQTKRQGTTDTQPNRIKGVLDGGQQFEIKMAPVFSLRGMNRNGDFELATNVIDAGNFGDLVYKAAGRRYCLHLKHTHNPGTDRLVHSELMRILHSCFETYIRLPATDKTEFIIYTNQHLGSRLLNHKTKISDIYNIFKTSDEGKILKFTSDDNKENDVFTLLEKSLEECKEYKCLSDAEKKPTLKKIKEFLNKLILFTGQKDQWELDDLIAEEIRKQDAIQIDCQQYKSVLHRFKTPLENWWRSKKRENITPEILRNWLQRAKTAHTTPFITDRINFCTTKLVGTGIAFSEKEISRLQAELSNKRAVHLRSDALTLFSKLLLDCLDTSKCIFITFELLDINKNMLLHAWFGGKWEWLIVFCDSTVQQSDISDTCLQISEIIQCATSSKRIVILTACSVQQISNFALIEQEFKFEQLSKESQGIVLDKTIDFQGCEVKMGSVLQRHGEVQHVLGPELVTDMITEGSAVKLGGTLQVNEGYHALRTLERKIVLHLDVLQNSNDVFVVSGKTMEDLLKIVPSGKNVESVCLEKINMGDFTQGVSGRIFLLSDKDPENSFLTICKKNEGINLHWVEIRNGEFLWKMSNCGTESLLDYIDADITSADKRIIAECMKNGSCEVKEDSIWDVMGRTVLVVAEPGMGKTSTTTQVAWHTKLADPTSWVVRIDWNDHTRKLQEINAATFNVDILVEFLCTAAFPESKYTDINKTLLKQALQNSGNVTVLMDGFDEISPTHADIAAVILSELMKTKVGRVWVTSRPVEKERLEKELCVAAFSMKKLSGESQKEMLQNLWMSTTGEIQPTATFFLFIWKLLRSINRSVHDENFTGSPLYITMIATVYEMEMETHLNSEDRPLSKIDSVTLYEKFVERKIQIYLTEKHNADITGPIFRDIQIDLKEVYFNSLEKCALVAILPPDLLELLKNKKIKEKVQQFLEKIQAGGDKKGIVMNVVDGKPQFVHRTFGEFFTAHWFSRKFESNRIILERILFDAEFGFVRDMFDRMLAKDCPLHCAVLEEDTKIVRTLLKKGYDANAVDRGGRTVMHIIAIHHSKSWDVIDNNCTYEVSLDTRDCVLQWTPLQYAIMSQNWFIVEELLKCNVDRSGLDMIRRRAQNPDYINSVVRQSADEGHVLLLQYLDSIGVQISLAVSRQH